MVLSLVQRMGCELHSCRLFDIFHVRPRTTSRPSWSLYAIAIGKPSEKRDRFDRTASNVAHVDEPCILTIDGIQYNVTSYAKAHPGGVKVLQKFHGKDATRAFQAAGHSKEAHALLAQFAIPPSTAIDNRHGKQYSGGYVQQNKLFKCWKHCLLQVANVQLVSRVWNARDQDGCRNYSQRKIQSVFTNFLESLYSSTLPFDTCKCSLEIHLLDWVLD